MKTTFDFVQDKAPTAIKTRPVLVGDVWIGGPQFSVIAGPCSIESREQFLKTAQSVKSEGACLLRGGVWKMRTSAHTFQGLGSEAFHFIRDVLDSVDLGLVSEITDPRQIEILDDYVEMYQVGARNMYNYSLLKELGQTRKPVLLKRGFSALMEEWVKAAEYIALGGNENIVLCERGIRTFETATRYTFDLNAVIWAKARTPFPVLIDPSHAVGVREFVPKVALAGAAVGADGVIVEVHHQPEAALSDGKQALTLKDFSQMMSDIERILDALNRPCKEPRVSTNNNITDNINATDNIRKTNDNFTFENSFLNKDPQKIKNMFSKVARQYDRANNILSVGIHHLWRKKLVKESLAQTGFQILDCATGTGDLAIEFKKRVGPPGKVIATDFCPEMLSIAPQKAQSANLDIQFSVADAMDLPFPKDQFDVVSMSFGIRNVLEPKKALSEMARVTKPGGRVLVLEFGKIQNPLLSGLYTFYSERVLPKIGGFITGQTEAYEYLQKSSVHFPSGNDFLNLMQSAGAFSEVRFITLSSGIAFLYIGIKSNPPTL